MGYFFYLFGLFLLRFLLFFFINLLNLRFVSLLALFFLFFLFVFGVSHLLLLRLLNVQLNWEANELGMFLDQVFQAPLLKEFRLVFFQIANYLSAALDFAMNHLCVLLNSKSAASARLPPC